jgi:hypothetical protein
MISGGRTRDRTLGLSRVKAGLDVDITCVFSSHRQFHGYSQPFWQPAIGFRDIVRALHGSIVIGERMVREPFFAGGEEILADWDLKPRPNA